MYKTIKELPEDTRLEGLKVRTKRGVVGYIQSIGKNFVMLNTNPKLEIINDTLYPQIINTKKDMDLWQLVDEKFPINCHTKKSLNERDNT